jgi:hypothetical protein
LEIKDWSVMHHNRQPLDNFDPKNHSQHGYVS